MSNLQKYISERQVKDSEFADNYESGYQDFKIGVMVKMNREEMGLAQEQLVNKSKTTQPAISRIENHAESIKLSP